MLHVVMRNNIKDKLDLVGMSVSLLCALHCAILPIILTVGVVQKLDWLDSPKLEAIFIISSLSIAGYSLTRSYRNVHQSIFPIAVAVLGFAIFFTGLYNCVQHHVILTSVGGITVLISHLLNYRLLHQK